MKKIKNLLAAYTNASHKIDHTKPLGKIHTDLELSLSTETNEENEAGRILDFLRDLSDSFQEEFEDLLADDSEKKRFIRALSRIFALFLNAKVDQPKKIKSIIKIAIETTRTNATVRRLPVEALRLPEWFVSREYGKKKRICPIKIKEILPEQKAVNITKDRKIMKKINIRKKSRYFNGRNRLIF